MGFGDGHNYISFGMDFDSKIASVGSTNYKGLLVYPPCDSPLAEGSVSTILTDSQQYAGDAIYAVRHALAGGSNDNWRQFGGERHDNGNNWPGTFRECLCPEYFREITFYAFCVCSAVTIAIENDEDANTVTLRFTPEHSDDDDLREGSVVCVYTGTFGAGESSQFTFGMLPDLGNGNDDNFHIESIDVAVTATGTNTLIFGMFELVSVLETLSCRQSGTLKFLVFSGPLPFWLIWSLLLFCMESRSRNIPR